MLGLFTENFDTTEFDLLTRDYTHEEPTTLYSMSKKRSKMPTAEQLKRTYDRGPPELPLRFMTPRAAPVQGHRVHSDGSILVTRVHDQAPRNLWVRTYLNRADFLAGRHHTTTWERRGCQPWRERPDSRDRFETAGGGFVETTYTEAQNNILQLCYSSEENHERGRWTSMSSTPIRDVPYNSNFDGTK